MNASADRLHDLAASIAAPDDDTTLRDALAATLTALAGSAPTVAAIDAAAARIASATPVLSFAPASRLAAVAERALAAAAARLASTPARAEAEAAADRLHAWRAGTATNALAAWNAAVWLLARAAAETAAPRRRLVVYTALFGAKEALANPLDALPPGATTDLELDFVCLTDDPALASPVWRCVVVPMPHLSSEKASRRPKALPHEYFSDADLSLYVDNTVRFRRLPQGADLATSRPYLFRAFRHATRTNPEQEAAAVAMLGYDDAATICAQMAFYAERRPLAEITPLTTATVLLREHHAAPVRRFGTLWWESVLAFSKRDQLSFDFARLEAGCDVEYLDGTTDANDLLRWHGSLSQRRVRASFDGRRYAWAHRGDASARHDPKAHFLAGGGSDDDAAWQRPPALLEVVCRMHGSSLGASVSPRRGVAAALEPLLGAERRAGGRWLLVRVKTDEGPAAFDDAEHEAAARALSAYLSPARGTLVDLDAAALAAGGVWARPDDAGTDPLAIVLGAAPQTLPAIVAKLGRLLDPARGTVAFVLSAPASIADAAAAETAVARALGATVAASLAPTTHDGAAAPLPNTLLVVRWQAAEVAAPA